MKFFLFSFLMLFLLGCQSGQEEKEGRVFSIDLERNCELSDILDSYTYTILETCNESLIREVSKMELTKDRIYILDKRGQAIIIFDREGNFIARIEKRGRGPGEYLSLTDMGILNSSIYVLARDAVIAYKEDGTWIKTIPLDSYYNYFHLIDDRLMYLNSDRSNPTMYDYTILDYADNSVVERFSPYEKIDSYLSRRSPFHGTDTEELLITDEYDHNIYSLTGNNPRVKYTLKFNTKEKLSDFYQNKNRVELYDQLANSNVVTYFNCLNQSDNFIGLIFPLFHENLGTRTHIALIDRETGISKQLRLGDKKSVDFPYFSNPILIKNGDVICSVDASRVISAEEGASLSDFSGKISMESNPVLFFYRLKSW